MPTFTFTSPEGKTYDVEGPEGATKEQAFGILQQKLGKAPAKTAGAAPAATAAEEGGFAKSLLGNVAGGVAEPAMAAISGAVAKPVSDVAGLAATGKEMIAPGGGDPSGFKREVQERLTYQPKTKAGQAVSEYNPLALLAKLLSSGAHKAGELVAPPQTSGPLRTGVGRGVEEAIMQAPGLLGAKGAAALEAKIPAKQAALDIERAKNAPLDEIRSQSQAAHLTTPPEGTSWLSGIPGMQKMDRWISGKNQPEFNRLIAQQFKLSEGTALSKTVLANVRAKAGEAYERLIQSGYGEEITEKQAAKVRTSPIVDERGRPITTTTLQPDITRIPGLPLTDSFKAPLRATLSEIEPKLVSSPETFGSLKQSASLLREYIKKNEMEPREAMDAIKHLRADAQTGFRSTETNTRQAAFTRLEIANRLENAFESNLEGNPQLLKEFRDARKTIAQSYDVEKVIDKAGNVDAQKLAAISTRRPLTENLKLVSDYASTFPKGAKKVVEGKQAFSPFDWMYVIAVGPIKGAVELAGRVGVPYAAEKGMLQKRMPSYQASTLPPELARILGVGTSTQANQLTPPPQ